MGIRLFKGPASQHEAPNEMVREFSSGPAGGLLALRALHDGGIVVEVYRTDGDVIVHTDDNVKLGTAGGYKCVHTVEGHRFEPWTNGHAVGFKVTEASTGSVQYVYLNPSGGSDDGQASVFLYQGPDADPAQDWAATQLDPFTAADLSPDEEYARAHVASIAAHNALDRAIRRLVAQKVKATYPTAVTLVVYGEYNEDGLLHANCERILDADHRVLAEVHAPTEEWEALTSALDPLLYQASQEDEDYQGETEIDLTDWDD